MDIHSSGSNPSLLVDIHLFILSFSPHLKFPFSVILITDLRKQDVGVQCHFESVSIYLKLIFHQVII
jgi:hypothetical protein